LLYWKKRLLSVPLTAIASQIRASDSTGAGQPDQLYYLLSDILPEDRITRMQLARDLLNEMLEKQQEERTDKGKARPCLFCRQAPRGRDELFDHMRDAHGFAVGQPDNLVGIDRLLDLLRAKLDGLQCIYCFPESDHEILTNRGFWRLADVEAHLAANAGAWADVRVASYDERARALVYETPKQLVVNAPDAADAALVAFKQTHVAAGGVDLVVTRGHNMFVRCASTAADGQSQLRAFEKATAERVVAARATGAVHDVRVLAAPPAGVSKAAVAGDWSLVAPELASSTAEERALFLTAYGARVAAAADADAALPHWVWQLDGASVRQLLAPLDGAAVRSVQLRDDVARAAMHAGVAAACAVELDGDGASRWRVRIGGECEPALDAAHYLIGGAAQRFAKDRTWCFEMPSGFVVVRRRADGAVSQATIQGNCERIFKDYATLRMHMKKKRHFKVNGRNKIYDQFYLINYLEWGKTWEDLQREPDDDGESEATISTISEIDPWRDWEETIDESDMLEEPTTCAVCDERCINAALALTHLVEVHDIDLIKLRTEWQLDVYATIKLINYLRWCYSVAHKCPRCALQCADVASLQAHVAAEGHQHVARDAAFWDDAQYLIPVVDNDPLLRAPDLFANDDVWSEDEEEIETAHQEAMARRDAYMEQLRASGLSSKFEGI
jgi:hypothetical protein